MNKKDLWKPIETKKFLNSGMDIDLAFYYNTVYQATFTYSPKNYEKEYKKFINYVKNVMNNLSKTDLVNKKAEKQLLRKFGYTSIKEINKNHKYLRFITKRFYKAVTKPLYEIQKLTDRSSSPVKKSEKVHRRIEVYKVEKNSMTDEGIVLQVSKKENRIFKPVNYKKISAPCYIAFDRFNPLKPVGIFSNKKEANIYAKKLKEELYKKLKAGETLNTAYPIDKENKFFSVSQKEIIEKFGIKKVIFKKDIDENQKNNIDNNIYEALYDLSRVLKLKPQKISLNGTLKIAIDKELPKYYGSSACAVFLPEKKILSFNKESGGGNLAHEWFHAFDLYLGTKFGKDNYMSELDNRKELLPEIENLIAKIKYKENGKQTKFYSQSLYLDRSELARFNDDSFYWSSDIEMLARAFAMFVKDSLGTNSDFLVRRRESNIVEPSFTNNEKIRVYRAFRKLFKKCTKRKLI